MKIHNIFNEMGRGTRVRKDNNESENSIEDIFFATIFESTKLNEFSYWVEGYKKYKIKCSMFIF